jgi:hypothetical protein
MRLLAHRGIWSKSDEKNSLLALSVAFELGIGIETDIRDCKGTLVVSHDPPTKSGALHLEEVLDAYLKYPARPILALNIKADGLHAPLLATLRRHGIDNYFVFDMSVPDTLGYQRLQMPFAARISEYESETALSQNAQWIWLDGFHGEWFTSDSIRKWLDQGKRVAIVSPELHRRPHLQLWRQLIAISSHPGIFLCTDFVSEAKEFFNANTN